MAPNDQAGVSRLLNCSPEYALLVKVQIFLSDLLPPHGGYNAQPVPSTSTSLKMWAYSPLGQSTVYLFKAVFVARLEGKRKHYLLPKILGFFFLSKKLPFL